MYSLDLRAVPTVVEVKDKMESDNWAEPVLFKNLAPVTLLLAETPLQNALDSWARQYKKAADTKENSRGQYPLQLKAGKEAVIDFFSKHGPPNQVDNSGVNGGPVFMQTCWLYGYLPEMKFCGMAPNSAPLCKLMVLGEVQCMYIDLVSLVDFMAQESEGAEANLEVVHNYVGAYRAREVGGFVGGRREDQMPQARCRGLVVGAHRIHVRGVQRGGPQPHHGHPEIIHEGHSSGCKGVPPEHGLVQGKQAQH